MLAIILEIISLIPRVLALFPTHRGLGDDIAATLDSILESGQDRLEELKDLRALVVTMVEEGRVPSMAELEALRRQDDAAFARLRAAIEARGSCGVRTCATQTLRGADLRGARINSQSHDQYSLREAASLLGCSERTVRRLVSPPPESGRQPIPHRRLFGRVYIPHEALAELLRAAER